MTSSSMPTTRLSPARATSAVAAAAVLSALAGCVFDSPYWGQTFASTATPVPIQTWTGDKNHAVKIECSKAYHGGLYPFGGPETWTLVTNITPSTNPSYDSQGGVVYSAGVRMTLPADCWRADEAYSPALYMTALRATQLTAFGGTTVYRVFDLAGLECMGRENGKGGSWFSWLNKNCALTYSNSTTALPWVKIIANTGGASATAAPAALRAPAPSRSVAAVVPPSGPSEAVLGKGFEGEARDAAWAAPAEARLRVAYDSAHPEGTTLLEAACRSTLCRVDVVHVDAAAQERFVAALAPAGLFANDGASGLAVHKVEGRGVRSTYFIAREGVDLSATPGR
jgi:hypothetical protein